MLSTKTTIATATFAPSTNLFPEEEYSATSLKKIAETKIDNVWWSDDSSTLFYRTQDKILVYDLLSDQVTEVSLDAFYQPTPQPEIISELPPEATRLFISPSGNRALYFTFIDIPPTPEGELGEYVHLGVTAELWFHDRGDGSRKLGEMEYCYPNGVLWTDDEQSIIVEYTDPLIRCADNYALLVTLTNDRLHPLLPTETYTGLVDLIDLSPNDRQLLGSVLQQDEEGNDTLSLFSLSLDTFQTVWLNTPSFSAGEAWLTNEKILIYYEQLPETSWALGVFDLEASSLVELTPSLENSCMAIRVVSPDRRRVAFATGSDCSYMDNLWLMEFDHTP